MIASDAQQFVIKPAPVDFDDMFVRFGRIECEVIYHARTSLIDAWLRQRGKKRLLDERAEFVLAAAKRFNRQRPPDFEPAFVMLGHKGAMRRYRASFRTVNRWIDECGRERLLKMREKQTRWPEHKINTRDIGRIISTAFPVRT